MKTWLWCIPMLLLISPVVSAGEAKSMEELGLIEEPEKPVKVVKSPPSKSLSEVEKLRKENERLKRLINQQNAQPKQAASLSPDQRLMAQGMWRDPKTNMIWMRCSLGQTWTGKTCKGHPRWQTWRDAQDTVAAMNRNGGFGGYTDWVLPHIEDLASLIHCNTGFKSTIDIPAKRGGQTIIQHDCKNDYQRPTIDQAIFPNTGMHAYWSASPGVGDAGIWGDSRAWGVGFNYGFTYDDSPSNNLYFVRAVRAGHEQ